jgi:hypothetical protein
MTSTQADKRLHELNYDDTLVELAITMAPHVAEVTRRGGWFTLKNHVVRYVNGSYYIDETPDHTLTISDLIWLGQINSGVERSWKMRWYPQGVISADRPAYLVLRAFTYKGGGLYPRDADVRDSFVWCSGITEQWIKVSDLMKALQNAIDQNEGENSPMAMIEAE